MGVKLARRRLKASEYYRMFEVGILTEQDKVELINGEIIEMSLSGSLHAAVIDRINFLLQKLRDRVIIRVQNPINLSQYSMPEPDISVLKLKDDFYSRSHPAAADIYLLIEVSDSSYPYDKQVKLPAYAQAGIPEYWIVNLEKKEIEAYHTPENNTYKEMDLIALDQSIIFHAFDAQIQVESILGNL